jgi:hypothetical protein
MYSLLGALSFSAVCKTFDQNVTRQEGRRRVAISSFHVSHTRRSLRIVHLCMCEYMYVCVYFCLCMHISMTARVHVHEHHNHVQPWSILYCWGTCHPMSGRSHLTALASAKAESIQDGGMFDILAAHTGRGMMCAPPATALTRTSPEGDTTKLPCAHPNLWETCAASSRWSWDGPILGIPRAVQCSYPDVCCATST